MLADIYCTQGHIADGQATAATLATPPLYLFDFGRFSLVLLYRAAHYQEPPFITFVDATAAGRRRQWSMPVDIHDISRLPDARA